MAGWLAGCGCLAPMFLNLVYFSRAYVLKCFLQSLLIPCSMYVTIRNRIIHNKHKKLGRYKEKRNLCGLAGCLSVPHKKYKNHMRNGLLAGLGRIVAVWLWLAGWLAGWLAWRRRLPAWLAVAAGPVGMVNFFNYNASFSSNLLKMFHVCGYF